MKIYDDNTNKSGMKILFMFAQIIVLAVVYIFTYSSFLVVGHAIEQKGANEIMYFPVFVALVSFPVLLYKYRQMFNKGKMLMAATWMMGTASLTIVLLYVYIAQLAG